MSNILHNLLGINSHHLTSDIHELESMTGHNGRDITLATDIIARQHLALRSLGLDPHDTTPAEIYYGLRALGLLHNRFLHDRFGVGHKASNDDIIDAVFHIVSRMRASRRVWVLKQSVVRKLLRKHPPKRTLKLLGYRSCDSMVKREPVVHILATAYHTESSAWRRRYTAEYENLQPIDFEERDIQLCMPCGRHWSQVGAHMSSQLQTNIIDVRELGAVVVLPLPAKNMPGLCLALTLLLLTHIEELRMYGSFFKSQQTHAQFGQRIIAAITGGDALYAKVGRQPFHWRLVHTYLGTPEAYDSGTLLSPHLTTEDIAWRRAETQIARLEPALDFWSSTAYVGYVASNHQGTPVSFNALDVLLNAANDCAYSRHTIGHMQASLWDELLMRYLSSNYVRSRVVAHLDHSALNLEPSPSGNAELSALLETV
jgi:hypothetical protein